MEDFMYKSMDTCIYIIYKGYKIFLVEIVNQQP